MSNRAHILDLDLPDYLKELVPYPPGKPLEELEREYGIKDAIKMASNENPLGPSPKAQQAVIQSVGRLHRYPDGASYYLKEKLCKVWGVAQENMVLGNGSNELIEFLVKVALRPGDEAISSSPSFLMYTKLVQAAGGKNVTVPLSDFRHDLSGIARSVTSRTRLIFLDNPHNPTGTVLDRDDFNDFLASLPDHVIVVLDEAYGEFVRDDRCPMGIEYVGKDSRVVFLRTFSKAYGLAGLRVGYGIMDAGLATYLERVRQPFNVNLPAQAAALAALEDQEYLKTVLETTWQGMEYLSQELDRLGCTVFPSQTNFILVDVKKDARAVYEQMLRQGVIIRAMTSYGFPTFMRITVGLPDENERCIAALECVLRED